MCGAINFLKKREFTISVRAGTAREVAVPAPFFFYPIVGYGYC